MRSIFRTLFASIILISVGYFVTGSAKSEAVSGLRRNMLAHRIQRLKGLRSERLSPGYIAPAETKSDVVSCSPSPCVFPPVQASESGYEVADAPIVANPLNAKQLLVGSMDFNCPPPSSLGFHLSTDGGSTWNVTCMDLIHTKEQVFWPVGADAIVGYDRAGVAYIAGDYADSKSGNVGFVGFQKSRDGVHWSKPAVSLYVPPRNGVSFPAYTWLAIDTNLDSPRLNALYVSGVVIGGASQEYNRVVVAHSVDGGANWTPVAVAPVQVAPAGDAYTNMAVGKDGTVYLTWMYCNSGPYFCTDNKGHMVFSKSTDGGNIWSEPLLMATVVLGHGIPNSDVGAENYPAIGVDNSDGSHAGNLYVVMYHWTGAYMRVQVIRSTDGGNTWSKPVPVAPPKETHDQFFPWLSVGPTGLVGVSWLDRRNDPANIDYQAFAAISRDGGQSFQPNVALTTAFSNPNNNGYPGWMGNRSGNTWAGPNFVAAWMDSSNGVNMQTVVGGIRLK